MLKKFLISGILICTVILTGCKKPKNENETNETVEIKSEQEDEHINNDNSKNPQTIEQNLKTNQSFKVYDNKISEINNNQEEIILNVDDLRKNNDLPEDYAYLSIDKSSELKLSPNEKYLFFDYFIGDNTCRQNGINLKTKEILIKNSKIGCGAKIIWSNDQTNVAFVWNHFDTLSIVAIKNENFHEIITLIDKVAYPSNLEENTGDQKYYWESKDTFIFEPDPEFYQQVQTDFKAKGLKSGKNSFEVN